MARAIPSGDRLQMLRRLLPTLSVEGCEPDEHLQYYLTSYGIGFHQEFDQVTYSAGYLGKSGRKVFCQFWRQETLARSENNKGTVFILHGYYDHSGLYGHIIHFFLQQGYSVFAFDEPGHGLSDGIPASIDSFSSYSAILRQCLDWAVENDLPHPFHLFGQSMGGAVITELLVNEGCSRADYPLGRIILFAPLIRPVLWRWGRMQYKVARYFLTNVPRSRSNNSHDKEFLDFLAAEPLQPNTLPVEWVGAMNRWIKKTEAVKTPCDFDVLIVQGQKDGTVDWRHNMPVYQRLYQSTEIFYIPEGRHHLVNEREDIRQKYLTWLARFF